MHTLIQTLQDNFHLCALLVTLLGLCIGSFLNVVIHRLPKMMEHAWREECHVFLELEDSTAPSRLTLSHPASHCPQCKHTIRWYENIPIISYLVLVGKCSQCKTPISWCYPCVELVTALASLVVFLIFGPTLQMMAALILTWCLIALVGIDFDTQLLPDRITLPLAGLGLLVNALSTPLFVSPSQAIWGYVFGFMSLWLVYIIFKIITGKEGMGYGDFKLLAALGAWLGPTMIPLIILLSSLVGSLVGLALLKIRKQNQPFAFGPYLAIAGWIALIAGPSIISFYLHLFP